MAIKGKVVAFLVADETDTSEFEPIVLLLRRAGATCAFVAPDRESLARICLAGDCPVRTGFPVQAARTVWFDGLVIPGGSGVDAFLHQDEALEFVRSFDVQHKPIAALGRGALLLVGDDLVDGRHLAVPADLERDVVAVGGVVVLAPLFKDRNLLTAKGAEEAPLVAEALVCALAGIRTPG